MAINLKVALGGAAAQYNKNVQDEDTFLKEMAAQRRAYLLEKGDATFAEIKKEVAASKGRVKKALNFGFTQEAALVLEATGQLASHITRLQKAEEKGDGINKNVITTTSNLIVQRISPEIQTQVFEYMSTGGYPKNITELQDKFMTVLLSTSGSTEEAASILSDLSTPTAPDLDPIKMQTEGFTSIGSEESNRIRKGIRTRIAGYLGTAINDSGNYVQGENSSVATRLEGEAFQLYKVAREDYTTTGDLDTVLDNLAESVRVQVSNLKEEKGAMNKVSLLNPYVGTPGIEVPEKVTPLPITSPLNPKQPSDYD